MKNQKTTLLLLMVLFSACFVMFLPQTSAAVVEAASYKQVATSYTSFNGVVTGAVWAFEANQTGWLDSISCHLSVGGSPLNGAVIMAIYNQTGVYGTSSRAGDLIEYALAPVSQSDFAGQTNYNVFRFRNTTTIVAGTKYVISVFPSGALDTDNNLRLGSMGNGNGYAGDAALFYSGVWNTWNDDVPFIVNVTTTLPSSVTGVFTLSGGVFTTAPEIAQAPTEITLQQGKQYYMNCSVYVNDVLGGNGTCNIGFTGFHSTWEGMLADNTFSYVTNPNGAIVNGTFSIYLPIGVNNDSPVYEKYRINATLADGSFISKTYYFGWYGVAQSGHSGVPYPTDGGGASDGSSGVVVPSVTPPSDSTLGSSYFTVGSIIGLILIVIFGFVGAKYVGGAGLFGGIVLALFVDCFLGFFPMYFLIVAILLGAILLMKETGYIGGSKQ